MTECVCNLYYVPCEQCEVTSEHEVLVLACTGTANHSNQTVDNNACCIGITGIQKSLAATECYTSFKLF